MIAKTRRLNKPLSVVLMLALMLAVVCLGYKSPLTAEVNASSPVENNCWYYIKNVKSGKYLTIQGGYYASVGAKLVQWTYTGANYQRWKLTKMTSGTYNGKYIITSDYHVSGISTDLVIVIADGSGSTGVQAKVGFKDLSAYQYYNITNLSNSSHRFMTNASDYNYALVANGASVYSNTSIVQGQTGVQWSDQWILQPVNKDSRYGVWYANDNQEHRLATYMDFDYYTAEEVPLSERPALRDSYESANFVSQCLNTCGKYYSNNNTDISYDWYSNKDSHIQTVWLDQYSLEQYWSITENWYKTDIFIDYYINKCHYNYQTYSWNNYNQSSDFSIKKGDIIIIGHDLYNDPSKWEIYLVGYITYVPENSGNIKTNYVVSSHTDDNKYTNWTVGELCQYFNNAYGANKIAFIKSSTL